jgi:lipoprotein NlpD
MTDQYRTAFGGTQQAWLRRSLLLVVSVVLVACAQGRVGRAPVETRSLPRASAAPLPDGEYRVQPGDTLVRIAANFNQDWRDLANWNQLSNPNHLEVGQVLRVSPPRSGQPVKPSAPAPAPSSAVTKPSTASGAEPSGVTVQPVTGGDAKTQPIKPLEKPAASQPAPQTTPSPDAETAQLAAQLNLRWPADGDIVATFDDKTNKGIGIAGKLGDPVVAAADGRVVYAGSGLRGYGNLVILKHDDTFLTAYAHNQSLAVREDQVVKKGDRIAQMGSSDADRVKLHFEVRRLGKPVDPLAFLPKR